MAKVACPCGRQYTIADEHLGKRVKCSACQRLFTARRGGGPSAKRRPVSTTQAKAKRTSAKGAGRARRLGELAVEQGYVTGDQLAACLEYKKALDRIPRHDNRRVGDILVEMSLITRPQLERLLREQSERTADTVAEAAASVPTRPKREHAVRADRLEAIRETVRAAAKRQERPATLPSRDRTGAVQTERRRRLRLVYVLVPVALGVAGLVALWLRPAPAPQRALRAYLESCREEAVQPDAALALRDLGLVVREFGALRCLPGATFRYAAQVAAAREASAQPTWADVARSLDEGSQKRAVLETVVPCLPEEVTPADVGSLEIAVRPVVGRLTWRRRGAGAFFDGRYRFLMVKVSSPAWSCGWRVAGHERVGEGAD